MKLIGDIIRTLLQFVAIGIVFAGAAIAVIVFGVIVLILLFQLFFTLL